MLAISNRRLLPIFAQSLRSLLVVNEPAVRLLSERADPQVQGVLESFAKAPQQTADQLAASLSPAQRAVLAAALSKSTAAESLHEDEEYVHHLFEAADIDGERGTLTKSEFRNALTLHRQLEGEKDRSPPEWRTLRLVFIASAIPFIGFGFLDNFIMLVAGEEIDSAFGVRLGLSTLASAGLGNLVADVIGVGAANGIESSVRKLPLVKNLKLSKHQLAMESTKWTKALGATAGVMVGCLLGLSPLFISGTFFTDR